MEVKEKKRKMKAQAVKNKGIKTERKPEREKLELLNQFFDGLKK